MDMQFKTAQKSSYKKYFQKIILQQANMPEIML